MSKSTPQTPEEKGQAPARGEEVDMTESTDQQKNYDQMQAQALEGIRTELSALNSKVDNFLAIFDGMKAIASEKHATPPEEQSSADDDVTIDHEYDTDELENLAYDWIKRAAEFNTDLLNDAVEIEFGQVEGEVGLMIEAGAPWNVGCHNGDSWTDKEKWDDHNEAFKSVMQSKEDEITYHGEPDYFNFLPAGDVEEVCS